MYEIPGKLIVGINNAIKGQVHIEMSRSTGIKRQGWAVCLSNSIQHLVTGCNDIGLCYQIISPYWVQGDAARAS